MPEWMWWVIAVAGSSYLFLIMEGLGLAKAAARGDRMMGYTRQHEDDAQRDRYVCEQLEKVL